MNAAQQAKYFAEWGKLRDVLRAKDWKNADIEQQRHEVTRRALGVRKSSKDFTNVDLDKVLARIAAEREPDNFEAQMALQDSPDKRRAAALEACSRACWEIYGHGGNNGFAKSEARERYIAGVARNVIKKELSECSAEELRVVHGILMRQLLRAKKAQAAGLAKIVGEEKAAQLAGYRDTEAAEAHPMPAVEPEADEPFDGEGEPF